ncbi:hypothetical protein BU17DRAFT_78139 [Hysterangium stoloniferum]|nr:hypothetical protein BU17DRAFT_78139 [Hysterangium stoloniferum]
MNRPQQFTKVDLKPKKYHGYAFVLFIFGTIFPPLAVAARFGIGGDFWLNLVLTICGYIPGHVHNFYIQNIRNNKNNRRTPKWASRYGLVDTSEIERKKRKSQWATRYADRLPQSTHEGRDVEEGQIAAASAETLSEPAASSQSRADALWNTDDESYYGRDPAGSSASGGRWHYPANFDDADALPPPGGKKKKVKKDRWARTEDARQGVGLDDDKKKKKKKKKSRHAEAENGDFINPRRSSYDSSNMDVPEGPEDPEGRQYGPSRTEEVPALQPGRNLFEHEF